VPTSVDDLLATAGDTTSFTVNSNANNFGVSAGQAVNSGELLRFEIVNWDESGFPPSNPVDVNDMEAIWDGMTDINGFTFGLDNVKAGSTSQLTISIYDEDSPLIFDANNIVGYDDTEDALHQINVSEIIIISGGVTYDFAAATGIVALAGFTVDFTGNDAHITGLHQGDVIEVFGTNDYNDITILNTSLDDNSPTGSDFKVNSPSLLTTNSGDPLDISFGTTQTDTDGDSATGTIDLTLDPSSSESALVGGPGADTLLGGAADDDLTGNGGADLFVLQQTGGGHDTIQDFLSGTDDIFVDIAAQNLTIGTATVLAAANFHSGDETVATTWDGGTGNEFVWNSTTHELWFSANGTGTDKIDLAHISTGTPVATDVHTF